jgi:hypothetical protein
MGRIYFFPYVSILLNYFSSEYKLIIKHALSLFICLTRFEARISDYIYIFSKPYF